MHLIEIIQNHVHERDEAENNHDHKKLKEMRDSA